MKIKSIKLKNFKRFTDLLIKDIPETARVVVVVGSNGSGKSSLFDALLQWYRSKVGFGVNTDENYYRKNSDLPFDWLESVEVTLADNTLPKKGSFYLRSAYRNDPDFTVAGIGKLNSPVENVRLGRSIDNDQSVSENYQRLVYDTMAGIYDPTNNAKSVLELRNELIGQLKLSMKAVFGDLILKNISDPLGSGNFFFEKGDAKSYHYKNLSGGEKSAFDLLLDLHIKKKFFSDAVYCIDEIETHLHTKVQGLLVREMAKVLPDTSQLWLTTHSLGVLRAAQEMEIENPGSVCIIDFDSINLDELKEISPSNLNRICWEKLMSIAIDDLSDRISPKTIAICEGSSIGTKRKNFDAEIYSRIFGHELTEIAFVSGGSQNQLKQSGISMHDALSTINSSIKIFSIYDLDDKSTAEVAELESSGGIVLPLRNIESFLFSDEVLINLAIGEGKEDLVGEILEMKKESIQASILSGNPSDDLKSAAGPIYVGLKRILDLKNCGGNVEAFMRDTLTPLIPNSVDTYKSMKDAIILRMLQ